MIRVPQAVKIPVTVLATVLFAAALLYALAAEPTHGAKNAPAHREVSSTGSVTAGTYYARNAYGDAHTPNMVTVTLADYRGFDTFGETTVVFCGCICVMLLLRARKRYWRK
ncbi:MAG: hydrogen gas-evolving membrane-bound hydrogenase subunit E [Planctomycetota bacterium]|jgi:multicomponent Na+:H+ antiporter subunit B